MTQTGTRTNVTKVATVFAPVASQDRALDFYVGTLGFEKRTDIPYGNGDRWVEVGPAGAETTIALVPPMQGQETTRGATLCSLYTSDIDADYSTLKAKGVDVDAEIMRMGEPVPPMFFFRDVDGNSLLIVGSN